MSKTVMRVMMIGLVAMLGAEAEAHYFIVGGKVKYCSVCVDVKLIKDETVPDVHLEEVEISLTTTSVDILCGTQISSPGQVNPLVVRRPIDGGDITTQLDSNGVQVTTAEVEAIVSDTALLVNRSFCGGIRPRDVLIREMHLTIKQCTLTPCVPAVSTLDVNCTLSAKFDLKH